MAKKSRAISFLIMYRASVMISVNTLQQKSFRKKGPAPARIAGGLTPVPYSSIPFGSSFSSVSPSPVVISSVSISPDVTSPGAASFPIRLCLFFSCFFCLINSFFLFSLLKAPGLANVPPPGKCIFMSARVASRILHFISAHAGSNN